MGDFIGGVIGIVFTLAVWLGMLGLIIMMGLGHLFG